MIFGIRKKKKGGTTSTTTKANGILLLAMIKFNPTIPFSPLVVNGTCDDVRSVREIHDDLDPTFGGVLVAIQTSAQPTVLLSDYRFRERRRGRGHDVKTVTRPLVSGVSHFQHVCGHYSHH